MSNHTKACKEKKQFNINQESVSGNLRRKNLISERTPSHAKKLITDACVEFAFLDNRPFETVNGDVSVKLIENVFVAGQQLSGLSTVRMKELIPNPTTISRNIDRVYKLRKEQLIKWCQSVDDYCVTVDFWTENHTGIHFGGVLLHHIDQNNQLHVFILGCYPYDENDQKAPSTRAFVEKILDEYGLKLNEEKYVMTDNENKMKCTFNSKCKRIGCSSHYLNKQVEHAFTSETIDKQPVDCDEVQELFKNVKAIVAHICRSHKQLKLSRNLQSYSDTRFNGAFYMLNVFSMVFDELFPIINKVCHFFVPFDEAFKELSDTNRPTLHRVFPLRQYLLNWCETKHEDHHRIQKLKKFLKQRINDSWILADEHYIATILHPRLKHFQIGLAVDREKAIRLLKIAIQNRINLESWRLESFEGKNLLTQCFDLPSSHVPLHVRECEEYLNTTVHENDDEDILSYWNKHKNQFPNIYTIARKVLAIPASNTEVERLFSFSKMTMTDKRTRLDPVKLNKLIFLRKNLHALRQLDEETTASRKRKAINESQFDDEDCNEQVTPSATKKSRIDNVDDNASEAELEEL